MKRFAFRAVLLCAALLPLFGIRASNWTAPAFNLHTGDGSGEVSVAINISGEAAAASVSPDNVSTINARKRSAGRPDTWGAETTITTTSAPTRSLIDINNSGDSITVGLAQPTDQKIYAMYSKGGTSTFADISLGVGVTIDKNEIAFAMDPNRQGVNAFGIVIWRVSAGTVFARTISVDTTTGIPTWGGSNTLSATGSSIQAGPETRAIAFDGRGNAYMVWSETPASGVEVVKFVKYTNGVGFGTATTISTTTGEVDKPVIDVDSAGNVVVIWHNKTTNGVEARCLSGGVWLSITQISSTSVDISADTLRLAVNGAGRAVAAWEEKKPDPFVRVSFLTNLSTCSWTSPVFASSALSGVSKLDIDVGISQAGEGTAIVAWDIDKPIDQNAGVITKFYHLEQGMWVGSDEVVLPSSKASEAVSVVLDMSPAGDAITGWKSKNTGSVFANYFPHVFPAISTSAKRKSDRFLGQKELFNVLRWGNNLHETVSFYKVYRNSLGEFIGTFNPSALLKFTDHNRPNRLESYLIITVQPDGDESFPLRVPVTK